MSDPFDYGEELRATAERLERERPLPSPRFRGELSKMLLARATGGSAGRAWALASAYACAGTVLFLIAIVGVAGVGPLAAG
jgi:hypothetical protein